MCLWTLSLRGVGLGVGVKQHIVKDNDDTSLSDQDIPSDVAQSGCLLERHWSSATRFSFNRLEAASAPVEKNTVETTLFHMWLKHSVRIDANEMCMEWSLRRYWVALGLALNDDIISGVHNVVLHGLRDYSGGLLHCGGSEKGTNHTQDVDCLHVKAFSPSLSHTHGQTHTHALEAFVYF